MASWTVILRQGPTSTELALIDKAGPINRYKFSDPNAFLPPEGDFTNQTQNVVPSVPNCWILRNFDIDTVSVGDDGKGEVFDSAGTFPDGEITWKVKSKI